MDYCVCYELCGRSSGNRVVFIVFRISILSPPTGRRSFRVLHFGTPVGEKNTSFSVPAKFRRPYTMCEYNPKENNVTDDMSITGEEIPEPTEKKFDDINEHVSFPNSGNFLCDSPCRFHLTLAWVGGAKYFCFESSTP